MNQEDNTILYWFMGAELFFSLWPKVTVTMIFSLPSAHNLLPVKTAQTLFIKVALSPKESK